MLFEGTQNEYNHIFLPPSREAAKPADLTIWTISELLFYSLAMSARKDLTQISYMPKAAWTKCVSIRYVFAILLTSAVFPGQCIKWRTPSVRGLCHREQMRRLWFRWDFSLQSKVSRKASGIFLFELFKSQQVLIHKPTIVLIPDDIVLIEVHFLTLNFTSQSSFHSPTFIFTLLSFLMYPLEVCQ